VSDKVDGPMPKLADFVRSTPRSYLDHVLAPVLSPVDNIVNAGEEPSWEPFIARIREIDARLRLAGLQVMLRTPTPQPVQFRVAQAGTAFYDPFSGITMLWSTEKGLLYSVGRDGLDDGGDSQLDITVAPLVQTDSAPVSAARAKVRATH
jgi:hypothetical protein